MHPERPTLGIASAFAGIYLIWGTTYLAIAFGIRTLPPFLSGAIRFVISGALMYLWLRLRGPKPFAKVKLRNAALCGVLLLGMGNGLVLWAQQGVPSGIAALIIAAVPIVVAACDWLFFSKRAPSAQTGAGILIALLGVILVVTHTRTLSGSVRPAHIVVLLIAVIAWSLGTLFQKKLASTDKVLNFNSAQMFAGGLFQGVLSLVDGEWADFEPARVSLESTLALLYLIVFGSIIAFSCYLWLLTRVSAQKVTTYALVNPVIALLLGAVVLHERITWMTVLSAALVLLGVALVLFQNRAETAPKVAARPIEN